MRADKEARLTEGWGADKEARLAEGREESVIADSRADKDGSGVESDVEIVNGVVVKSAVESDVVIGEFVVIGSGIKGVAVVAVVAAVAVAKFGICSDVSVVVDARMIFDVAATRGSTKDDVVWGGVVEPSSGIVTVTEPIIKVKGDVVSVFVAWSSEPVASANVPVSSVAELVRKSNPVAVIMGGATTIEVQVDVVADVVVTFAVVQLETVSFGDPEPEDGGENDAGTLGFYSSTKPQGHPRTKSSPFTPAKSKSKSRLVRRSMVSVAIFGEHGCPWRLLIIFAVP
jgi:hypothetical protein